MTKQQAKTATERQNIFVEKRLKAGFKRRTVWIKPKHNKALNAFVEQLNN